MKPLVCGINAANWGGYDKKDTYLAQGAKKDRHSAKHGSKRQRRERSTTPTCYLPQNEAQFRNFTFFEAQPWARSLPCFETFPVGPGQE